jgi:uncharacterized protein (DUF2147 family)
MKAIIFGLSLSLAAATALAQPTPVGRWKTVDENTKEVKSVVVITEAAGVLSGKIDKIMTANKDAKCTECTDDRKGQPVQGMTIIRGLKKFGDGDKAEWGEGEILDPQNGKLYKCRLRVQDGGKTLEVRGFVGVAMMGRSQYWVREQ